MGTLLRVPAIMTALDLMAKAYMPGFKCISEIWVDVVLDRMDGDSFED